MRDDEVHRAEGCQIGDREPNVESQPKTVADGFAQSLSEKLSTVHLLTSLAIQLFVYLTIAYHLMNGGGLNGCFTNQSLAPFIRKR